MSMVLPSQAKLCLAAAFNGEHGLRRKVRKSVSKYLQAKPRKRREANPSEAET
jgi:hypothetical protein